MQESQSPTRKTNGRWTREEHLKFLQGLRVYGKNWKKIEQLVETRTGSQIRSHAQKFFLKTQNMSIGEYGSMSLEESAVGETDEPTLISKSGSEYGGKREDCSFFLGRIMEHWEDKQCLDFWKSLVDSKDATENSNAEKKNNSFTKMKVFSCDNMQLKRPTQTYF